MKATGDLVTCPVKMAINQAMEDLHRAVPDLLVPWSVESQNAKNKSWVETEKFFGRRALSTGLYLAYMPSLEVRYAPNNDRNGYCFTRDDVKHWDTCSIFASAGCQRASHEALALGLRYPKALLGNQIDLSDEIPRYPHIVASTWNHGMKRVEFRLNK